MKDGGPAFPSDWTNNVSDRNAEAPDGQIVPPGFTVSMSGATLRDWFAGKALAGLLHWSTYRGVGNLLGDGEGEPPATIAAAAYRLADAMLAARGR